MTTTTGYRFSGVQREVEQLWQVSLLPIASPSTLGAGHQTVERSLPKPERLPAKQDAQELDDEQTETLRRAA